MILLIDLCSLKGYDLRVIEHKIRRVTVMRKTLAWVLALILLMAATVGYAAGITITAPETSPELDDSSNKVMIYCATEDYRIEYFMKRLKEKFPDYDITMEYMSTGNLAAKLLAEGKDTDADIVYDLDAGYAEQLSDCLADMSAYDQTIYMDDCVVPAKNFLPTLRNGGAIIVNTTLLQEKGLAEPTSYADLLKPEYKGLISMPSPKSSGSGYMFLKSLVNAWGEEKAFEYFDGLAENILQFTTSGSGPVNALVQNEAVIGLGQTGQAVTEINNGANLKILYFEEGSPYSLYGFGIPEGKQNRKAVKEVFDFFYTDLVTEDLELFFPEPIYKEYAPEIKNYPTNIKYADMSGNTAEEKARLLDMWEY